jgi:glycosyltransferase involved in cell wall biosynthesis
LSASLEITKKVGRLNAGWKTEEKVVLAFPRERPLRKQSSISPGPLVSVTTCFLNAANFLREAIDSVLSQTLSSWELTLVDDGSTDDSTTIAKQYARWYPNRISYIEHEGHKNLGLSTSRNVGIAHATGKYVAFLDADDVWFRHKLEKQTALLEEQSQIDVYVSPGLYGYEDGSTHPQPMTLPMGEIPPGVLIGKILENDINTPLPSGLLVRCDVFGRLGGFSDWAPNLIEDQAMFFRIGFGASFYYDPECLVYYRVHPSSVCMSTPAEEAFVERMRLYAWIVEHYRNQPHFKVGERPLSVLAQYKLGATLLEYINHLDQETTATSLSDIKARFKRNWERLQPYAALLGPLVSGLFLTKSLAVGHR